MLMILQAKLPKDMRPVLAPSQHNKIPTAVRQVIIALDIHTTNLPFLQYGNLYVQRINGLLESYYYLLGEGSR